MTKENNSFAMMPPMKTNRLMMNFLMASFLTLPLLAQEKSMSDGLRDALYLEEVKRDPAAAASAYESLLDGYAQQQQFAATALFRLAEIRRAEGRKDEAIALYQRLIAQFPNADAKTKLAKENLAALGAKMPETGAAVVDKEELELQRLKSMHESSPDLVDHEVLDAAVDNGYLRIVEWLMKDVRVQDIKKRVLTTAADNGYAKMTTLLIELLGEASKEQFPAALSVACRKGYQQVARILLTAGANPNQAEEVAKVDRMYSGRVPISGGCPLVVALKNGHYEVADLLLDLGANLNSVEGEDRVTPLVALIVSEHDSKASYLEKLIAKGADIENPINVTYGFNSKSSQSPIVRVNNLLSLALIAGDARVASTLLAKGIKKNRIDLFACIGELQPDQLQVAEVLIEAGVDPNSKVHGGLSLLAMAYKQQLMNLVKLLLAKGANPNVESRLQEEDFHENIPNLTKVALYAGEVEDLLMFLNAGGDPGPQPKLDYAFNKAYTRDKLDTPLSAVKALVEKGFAPSADWRTRNFEGASNEVRAYLNERFPAEKPKAEEKPKLDPFE
jgi:ankyrin repeat protein